MAEVWVSYDELAALCGCTTGEGRVHAKWSRWPERVGRDGVARTLLPDDLACDFMNAAFSRMIDEVSDRNVARLSAMRGQGAPVGDRGRALAS